ncbi:MAG: hypothetical protein EPO21_16805 [Chloroflexota bacterium]|nr:MAG: hypothetical protein EPO21_16805 [Chloroflexota bacterium]
MLERLESADSRVWEGHTRVLEDATHMLGGIGAGLLLYSVLPQKARNIGVGLLGVSFLMHLYAFTTSRSRTFG